MGSSLSKCKTRDQQEGSHDGGFDRSSTLCETEACPSYLASIAGHTVPEKLDSNKLNVIDSNLDRFSGRINSAPSLPIDTPAMEPRPPLSLAHAKARLSSGFRGLGLTVESYKGWEESMTALHRAVAQQDFPEVQRCLDLIHVDEVSGRCQLAPLHIAVLLHYDRMANFLLERGASVDQRDVHGVTPLFYSSWHGEINTARVLLSFGANPDAIGWSEGRPLHLVCRRCNASLVKLSLGAGAHVNVFTKNRWTPLHFAACDGADKEIVKLLLNHGATLDNRIRPSNTGRIHGGFTAKELAKQQGNSTFLQVIKNPASYK